MKVKVQFALLILAVIGILAAPVMVDAVCGPETPDYWCGYECENSTTCASGGSAQDACVWIYYTPGICYTDQNSAECGSSCEL